MTRKALEQRWESTEGRARASEVFRFLLGVRRDLPDGVGMYEGRGDLRGLTLPDPKTVGRVVAGGVVAEALTGLHEFRAIRWQGLDLSHARLPNLRFFGAAISDCLFDGTLCRDWRLWDSEVTGTSFAGSDLRDAALGTWQEQRTNTWRDVSFDGADLRGALALGCVLERCSFSASRLKDMQFLQAAIRHCRFSGSLQNLLFGETVVIDGGYTLL